MRIAALLLTLVPLTSIPLAALPAGCGGAVTPTNEDAGGSTFPVEDGAACGCASPDCVPNCSDLPPCKLECTADFDADTTGDGGGAGGATLVWVDSCGVIQYAESCPNGCQGASPLTCH